MALQSAIRVDSIVDLAGTGPVELPYGVTVPAGNTITAQGNVSLSGIVTFGNVSSTSLTATTITAKSFVGNGSALTGLPVISSGKAIAIALIS